MRPAASTRTAATRSCIALITVFWAMSGMAGVEPLPAAHGTQGAALQAEAAPATQVTTDRPETVKQNYKPAKRSKGKTLRCWQYGRLIFEEPVTSLPPSLAERGQVFEGKSGRQAIQLLDIHTATCLVQ